MDDRLQKVTFGCLLHDIGKIVQRSGIMGKANDYNHSEFGEMYAKKYLKIEDNEILEQILYHHEARDNSKKNGIKEAYDQEIIKEDSLAFITNCADNIASGSDRRLRDEATKYKGWKWNRALHSVFNCFYEESERYRYDESKLMSRKNIPYPQKKQFSYSKGYYSEQLNDFFEEIQESKYKLVKDSNYLNALICLLEKHFTFMADDTANAKLADVSLFDHLKMTAAFGSCMYLYAKEQKISNYYEAFLKSTNKTKFYCQKAFLLISFNISGIQKFVYSIPSENALKNMRGRSFYVNLLMEFVADRFMDKLELTRANILYIGGGSATLLVPNLKDMVEEVKRYVDSINMWLTQHFQETLYLEFGCSECSAYDFRTKYSSRYKEKTDFKNLISDIQLQINEKKNHRLSPEIIRKMNPSSYSEQSESSVHGERECKICQSTAKLIYVQEKDMYCCPTCLAILKNANSLLTYDYYGDTEGAKKNKELFSIEQYDDKDVNAFLLPFDKQMRIINKESSKTEYVYNKNNIQVGINLGKYLWVGDYAKEKTLESLAEKAKGIHRIAVIRADVDDLGESFRTGFEGRPSAIDRNTISRKATYSRMMALFFQYYLNGILEQGEFSLEFVEQGKKIKRNAAIVYSGGDDLFIVGGWDDIIGFAVDLHNHFEKYSQNKLTISAGIGIYPPKYPIAAIAKETGVLELCSKLNVRNKEYQRDKDSITLFSEEFTFHWDCFIEKVLGEKYLLIKKVFDSKECGERGITFLHTILILMKNIQNSEISLARYAFLIARLEPKYKKNNKENAIYKRNYLELKEKLYKWMKNACGKVEQKNNDENDVKQCIVAIYLYLYLRRKDDGTE